MHCISKNMKSPTASEVSSTMAPVPQNNSVCISIPLLISFLLVMSLYFSNDPPLSLRQEYVDPSGVSVPFPALLPPEAVRILPKDLTNTTPRMPHADDLRLDNRTSQGQYLGPTAQNRAHSGSNIGNNAISIQTRGYLGEPGKTMAQAASDKEDSSILGKCDLSLGAWVVDVEHTLYTNTTCAFIQEHQNCLKNGRPDLGYLKWRWKPAGCDLPYFDSHAFLSRMTNKTMAFVGDSIARNQMQSLICALSQLESPQNIYRDDADRFLTWRFPSYNFTLSVLWSPYLVKLTEDKYKDVPQGMAKLFLDVADDAWMSSLQQYDFVILSTGQWYFKTGIYILGGEVIGCHYCRGLNISEVGFYWAYETALLSVYKHIISTRKYTGMTILRTFSPDHFENGTWSTGGTCLRTLPFKNHSLDGVNYHMREIQVHVFNNVSAREPSHASKLKLLDITHSALLRPDGHPGPYRYYYPFANGSSGHVQNDCLHWCLPGPIDTWNEMLFKILM